MRIMLLVLIMGAAVGWLMYDYVRRNPPQDKKPETPSTGTGDTTVPKDQ